MATQIDIAMNENPTPSTSPGTPAQSSQDSPEFDTFTPETNQQAPPPAASLVVNGEIQSEREKQLLENLRNERKAREEAELARRKAEIDAAYAQDEARRLKDIHLSAAATKPKAKRVGVGFWETEEN